MKNIASGIIGLLFIFTCQAQNLYFKHLGIADGLSQIRIQTIYQDEIGAIWLGTSEGLNRYNGTSVSSYSIPAEFQAFSTDGIDQICGNKRGKLYVKTQGKVCSFDLHQEKFTILIEKGVKSLFCEQDTLWAACENGIYYCTEQEKQLKQFTSFPSHLRQATRLYVKNDTIWAISPTHLFAIPRKNSSQQIEFATFNNDARCIFVDHSNNIWIGSWSGVYRISPSRHTTTHYTNAEGKLSDDQIRSITEDNFGNIWIGTFRGLDCYHPQTDSWSHYVEYGDSPNTLSHNSILDLYKDKQGNIWAGTYFGGVNIFNPTPEKNYFYHANPLRTDWLNFPVISKMTEDLSGNLWICTEGGGLNQLNLRTGKFTHYTHQPGNPQSIGSNNLKSIYFDPTTEILYVGTHFGGLYIFDTRTKRGHSLHHQQGNPNSLPHDIVNSIQPYREGLLLLTQGGVVYMDKKTEKFSEISQDSQINQLVKKSFTYETFLLDSHNRLWLGLSRGGVICIDLTTSHITKYLAAPLSSGGVSHIFEDRYGEIYVGTTGAGMFHYQRKEDTFKQYNIQNQSLPSNFCYYIGESKAKNCLYLIHGNGISLFNTQTETIENTYRLFNQSYSLGSCLFRDKRGYLYIGGTNGMAVLKKETTETLPPHPHFDQLSVFNKTIQPGDETGILSSILDQTREIHLKHNQNNLTIEIATYSYIDDVHSSFEYTLEGFDQSWNRMQGKYITYTNLSPGNYTLKVRPVISGKGQAKEACLNIHVAPPFYASIWAYLLYTCIIGGLIFVFLSFVVRQTKLRASLASAQKEKEHIEAINQMKIDFFTNVSHEFRTPLTLILGQLEALIQTENLQNAVHNRLVRIYKNAWNMRRLISELLDFRKQEQGCVTLRVEEQELVEFIKQTCLPFIEYAHQKEINFKIDALTEHLPIWIDPLQMQKVISNLLLNALKYTPSKGSITVSIRKIKNQAVITVADTGCGIAEKDLTQIFERFYQAKNNSGNVPTGTGIGLSIAQNIIKLHHGTILATSKLGEGSLFTIHLPLGQSHFSPDELVQATEEPVILSQETELPPIPAFTEETDEKETEPSEGHNEKEKPILLLVEENEELCSILKEALETTYEVYVVHNGKEGWEKAQEIQPELVITDLIIPEMSGKELCYKIKNNIELAQVSVILITGQMSTEQMIEAFRFGIDDYIIKPFDIRMLLARCRNLLKNKSRLKAYYTNKAIPETSAEDAISESDRKLLQKCIDIIRENFTNPDFDVASLANALCMGRSKLYTKFKQLVGLPPNEFILKIKLEEAMSLLKEHPELNISEVSMQVGFSSPRYFSKLFKNFFGITPQSIRGKGEKTNSI